jgi:hypothetical protein
VAQRLAVVALAALAAGCGNDSAPADAFVALDAPEHVGAGPGGGLLDNLVFAVVGDSRPVNPDDTANYPTAIVQTIFDDVEHDPTHPRFTITTGDYMHATTTGTQVDPQLDLYLGARAAYTGVVYPAMGNHECNSLTQSNCGPNGPDGEPPNYTQFLSRLVAPVGESRPYYVERFAALDKSWTAKLVFVAANAWDAAQAAWFQAVLADEPTTYTFVVRHEPPESIHAPGVPPTTALLATYPPTLLIVGHIHTYEHVGSANELMVGNGGAPLDTTVNFGYVTIARRSDGVLEVTSRDYQSLAVVDRFDVDAAGNVVAQPGLAVPPGPVPAGSPQ